MRKKYPAWIDAYSRSIHQAYVGMTPAQWGPIDFFASYRALNGAFIKKLYEAVTILKAKEVPIEKIARSFLTPSAFRAAFYFAVYEYGSSDHSKSKEAKEVFDFFDVILRSLFKKDIWASKSNCIHSKSEIDRIIRRISWSEGDPDAARAVARLGNSASALAYALYRDYYVTEAQEVYGPYDVSKQFGEGHILIIKHYPKLRPVELWPHARSFRHSDIKLYLVYKNVSMTCEFIGMHTLYKGDLIEGLQRYAVEIDGVFCKDAKKIERETDYLGRLAIAQWRQYEKMSKTDLKMKFLEWMCYSCQPLFKLARTDRVPSLEMIRNLRRAKIGDCVVLGPFPSYRRYLKSRNWEAYWLRKLYGASV